MARTLAGLTQQKIWITGIACSVLLHAGTFSYVTSRSATTFEKSKPVKVRIVEKIEPLKKIEAVPVPPKPIEKPKPKPVKKVATERQPKASPIANAQPIQGLDKSAVSDTGKGIAVPIGNTLMTEDKGIRVKDAAPMAADLSADAKLLRESITTPEYTDAALDANFEGVIIVDVFVTADGMVKEAELRRRVGFGMDDRIITAALKSRFIPRKNKLGGPESGWTEIRFTMQIP